MGQTMAQKIIAAHLVDGRMEKGEEIGIRMDQTLTQDSTGTMAYLQFEAMEIDRVQTLRSMAYIDHNMLQSGFENADDHKYIQTVANKHGIYFSRPGNGICHQVELERFAVPGQTLIGSDSHTPSAGGVGMLGIGAGGLDTAVAMGGGAYYLPMPGSYKVYLTGELQPFVSGKDVILEVLRRLTVKGGVGYVMEYVGPGVASLSVPERATITNMGAELGATSSLFPADEVTHAFLKAQGREADYTPFGPDDDAVYDAQIEIDLSTLVPMAACPHMPDIVKTIEEIGPIHVDQVCIGSCTNSSFADMMHVAAILKGKHIAPSVSLTISPGSKQVLYMLAQNGALADMIAAGARILESGCGPCIGMGQSPASDAVSVRSFNRNFFGRSGTTSADVYLAGPETCAATALTGVLTDPRTLDITLPDTTVEQFFIDDGMIVPPAADGSGVEVVRGPNIKPFPIKQSLADTLEAQVLLKMEDNITTDHIMPSNARLLPYRSNIPHLADFCLTPVDETFPARAKAAGGGILVGGQNYGQGSSREHAALAPLQLGIQAVIVKSFARIHMANLINNGILPLVFKDEADYDKIARGASLRFDNLREQVLAGGDIKATADDGTAFTFALPVSGRNRDMLLAGGLINMIKEQNQNG